MKKKKRFGKKLYFSLSSIRQYPFIHLGWVVRKPINPNPASLKIKPKYSIFLYGTVFYCLRFV